MSFPNNSVVTIETNPYFTDEDGNPVIPNHVYLAAGVVTFDSTGARSGPNLLTPLWTWTNPTGDPLGVITEDLSVYTGGGAFMASITASGVGVWEWRMWGDGPIQATTFVGSFEITDTYAGWPEPYGYCSPDNVQARINAGSWDSTAPGAFPQSGQVIDFIREASSIIDAALLGNGFYVPLVPRSGFTAIMPQAWLILRTIAAELATAYIEQARHGSSDTSVDSDAKAHLAYAEELLQKIGVRQTVLSTFGQATSKISRGMSLQPTPLNLWVFGADGAFPPVPDKSKGMLFTGTPPTSISGVVDQYGNNVPNQITLGSTIL